MNRERIETPFNFKRERERSFPFDDDVLLPVVSPPAEEATRFSPNRRAPKAAGPVAHRRAAIAFRWQIIGKWSIFFRE
jgi:hypothetical protein